MKINGFSLRTAIRNHEAERDATIAALSSSLRGGSGPSTEDLMNKIEKLEKDIAKLQAHQTEYNLTVTVKLGDEEISLAEAVKRLGGIERVSARWRDLMKEASNMVLAAAVVTFDTNNAIQKSKKCAMEVSTLRGKMNAANSVEIDIPDLEESLLE